MTAQEARKITINNNYAIKKVIEKIKEAANNGDTYVTVNSSIISPMIERFLENDGYEVTCLATMGKYRIRW